MSLKTKAKIAHLDSEIAKCVSIVRVLTCRAAPPFPRPLRSPARGARGRVSLVRFT